jgi:hypothetical protein
VRMGAKAAEGRNPVFRVGICWRAGDWNPERSVPDRELESFSQVRDVEWCSLQFPSRRLPFVSRDLACADLLEYARRIADVDLVITVDSLTAHLAGALGQRVWTLLPHSADWRWMERREDTPWYPTMRLFRQPAPGKWAPVIDAIAGKLRVEANGLHS